ncbi:HD domain-containing protein [Candidatus Woesearchaeota archaeon]|nr:HD domain-containing protein [Candidatus Woesearchaeota archaeon]
MEYMLGDMQDDYYAVRTDNIVRMQEGRDFAAAESFEVMMAHFDQQQSDVIIELLEKLRKHHGETYCHCRRVAADAFRIVGEGRPWYDTFETQTMIAQMGLLHDIGKLRVDAAILDKGYRGETLTSADWKRIRQHTRAGYERLKDKLPLAAYAAGTHHPEYAVKARSPAEGAGKLVEIITMVDCFDALLTRQNPPYDKIDICDRNAVRKVMVRKFPGCAKEVESLIMNTY